MNFKVEKTVTAPNADEAKDKVLAALTDDGCEILSHANHEIVATRGSQAKLRLLGSSMTSLKEFPVEVKVTFTPADSEATVEISAHDTYGIGIMVGVHEQYNDALNDIVAVVTDSLSDS